METVIARQFISRPSGLLRSSPLAYAWKVCMGTGLRVAGAAGPLRKVWLQLFWVLSEFVLAFAASCHGITCDLTARIFLSARSQALPAFSWGCHPSPSHNRGFWWHKQHLCEHPSWGAALSSAVLLVAQCRHGFTKSRRAATAPSHR